MVVAVTYENDVMITNSTDNTQPQETLDSAKGARGPAKAVDSDHASIAHDVVTAETMTVMSSEQLLDAGWSGLETKQSVAYRVI